MPKKNTVLGASSRASEEQHSDSESGDDHDHDDYGHDHDSDHVQGQEQSQGQEQKHTKGNSTADETTPVKRKRLTQACDPCRKKKIKCDGVKPSCANCTKLNANCTYLPSMKKRGPRQGYIELLEKRLDKMEKLLQHGPSAIDPELLDSKSIFNSRLRPGSNSRRSASPEASESGDQGEPKVWIDPDERYFGTTSGYKSQYTEYGKQSSSVMDVVGAKYNSGQTQPREGRPKNPIYGIKDEIPRKDILDHLVSLFFDSIYFQLPIIHPGTFMKQYKEGKVSPGLLNAMCAAVARFSTHPDVVTTPAFLAGEPFATNVRGMLVESIDTPTVSNVQALLFLSMYEYGAARGPRAWMFGGMAVRMAQELGLNREDSSPVFHLKGDWVMRETRRRTFWACFMLDILASSSSGRPRMMDERDCEVLLPSEDHDWCDERPVVTEMLDDGEDSSSGTEQEPTSESQKPDESVPGLQSTVSTTETSSAEHTAPNSLESGTSKSTDSISTSSKSKRQGGGHVLSSFAYLIRIVAVLGKVSQYVNRPRSKKAIPPSQRGSEFSVIDAALTAWHKSIPSHLTDSFENGRLVKHKGEGCIIVFMHIIYHTAVVLLHRPILAADKAAFPHDPKFVENSVSRCADAASKVSDVLELVQSYNCPPRIFISAFFAYPVFTTATIHITNAFASDATVASRARRSLSTHVKILQTMKSYWAMADKFFYIIRDLYSIQSKISSSASRKSILQTATQEGSGQGDNPFARREPSESFDTQSGYNRGAGGIEDSTNGSEPSGKLASISSFLKSDSGLIALWRRATEMQVLDEAKQEQHRLSMSEEAPRQNKGLEGKRELHPEDKALREHRERMNALEIQQINQEFDRRWRSRVDVPTLSAGSDISGNVTVEGVDEVTQQSTPTLLTEVEKRHREESINPRSAKQARTSKTAKEPKPTFKGAATSSSVMDTQESADEARSINTRNAMSSFEAPGDETLGTASSTYQHTVIQQPQQLKLQESYILQPMRIQPASGPPKSTVTGPAVSSGNVSRQLMDIYAQQQHEVLAQSIDMAQNSNIQRQQQQLRLQQGQSAQSPSLAFGPAGGFTSASFFSSSSLPNQSGFSSQGLSSTMTPFDLPLVYGTNYDGSQTRRIQTESLGSIFDFALPQGDISFLSNSFQVSPTMMQEGMGLGNNSVGISSGTGGSGLMNDDLNTVAATGTSPVTSSTGSASTPLNRSLEPLSPNSDPSQLFNISPQLHNFLMPDDPYHAINNNSNSNNDNQRGQAGQSYNHMGMQATPTNLIRYLQLHHQQELRQQELQQQNTQPLLNQQNSLIFDDYFPWNAFSTISQPPPTPPTARQ
ncbi:hypothetical protein BX616_007536 [Lobosporangium transversale]|uniref:Fungal-specific transcription factor domain-domain-containing protein n=1 Tax=Lobosporangium transversale TaxID=64571 RepID=A0A1Y2GNH1_9FUNG|nr:fungal-specific transcription factor domain-domain-containing protein [Lobosporangium transversale]KAF9914799.1 hypothetical protein BX616_007536 [Lobosporangium transversale]ORZ12524.1 fungal-specific transcription factor domain-domain-containing protein [Lobosporangium transversale]|eukprot:XP_021880143.1 fungal-specific transcription factor domain-domain-containing protein [Lobosporangium transversale]